MKFEDLPEDNSTWNLRDPEIAQGVVDLVIGMRDRVADSALILLCDPEGYSLGAPMLINEIDWEMPPDDHHHVFNLLTHFTGLTMVFAIARWTEASESIASSWVLSAQKAAHEHGVELLSCWQATSDDVTPLPIGELAM